MDTNYTIISEINHIESNNSTRPTYKLIAKNQPFRAVTEEITRFLVGFEEVPTCFNHKDFDFTINILKEEKPFFTLRKNTNEFGISSILIEYTFPILNTIPFNEWDPVFDLLREYEELGDYHVGAIEVDSKLDLNITGQTLWEDKFLNNLGIETFAERYPNFISKKINITLSHIHISLRIEDVPYDTDTVDSTLEQCCQFYTFFNEPEVGSKLLDDIKKLKNKVELSYKKGLFNDYILSFIGGNYFCFKSVVFGNIKVSVANIQGDTLIEFTDFKINNNKVYYHRKNCITQKYGIGNFNNLKDLIRHIFRLGLILDAQENENLKRLILVLHFKLTSGVMDNNEAVQDKLHKEYISEISESQTERWSKGILDIDIKDDLNAAIKEVKIKKEDYNYIRSNSIEILYDGINLLVKHECDSEKWEVLDISTVKTSLDLYDLVYIEFMSKHGINLSRFLLIQIIERVSVENNLSSYDLLIEYEAIVSVRSKTEKHQAIIAKWEKENDDDDYEEDGQNGFYSNDFLRKSYNEYYGHPDAEGWVDTSDY